MWQIVAGTNPENWGKRHNMNLSGHKNLKLLWWLRSIAIIGQATAIAVVTHALQIPLPLLPLCFIIGALVLVNLAAWWRIQTIAKVSDAEFFGQLLIDMIALWGLLYFTGGATNPFASLFILQVIIAATTLAPRFTWAAAAIAIALYTSLMIWNVEVPYFQHHHIGDFFNLHVQGMWISFILLALIVSWFVVRMNMLIRKQDALLAEAEKLTAIGALAANAAHELGTPLATLLVLAEDAGERAPMFKEQLARCKQILSRITAVGGVMRAEGGAPMQLDQFFRQLITHWQADHPKTKLTITIQEGAAPRILGEYGFEQAIRNVLDNAADASPEKVDFTAQWTPQTLTVTIRDYGTGIAHDIADTLGEVGATTKADGLGLGLFLSRSVVTRLGGTFELKPVDSSAGLLATITLPLKRLVV